MPLYELLCLSLILVTCWFRSRGTGFSHELRASSLTRIADQRSGYFAPGILNSLVYWVGIEFQVERMPGFPLLDKLQRGILRNSGDLLPLPWLIARCRTWSSEFS